MASKIKVERDSIYYRKQKITTTLSFRVIAWTLLLVGCFCMYICLASWIESARRKRRYEKQTFTKWWLSTGALHHWLEPYQVSVQQFNDILNGAYCVIENDGGELARRWLAALNCIKVRSSHQSLIGSQSALFIDDEDSNWNRIDKNGANNKGAMLFGTRNVGTSDRIATWFQLERYAVDTHPMLHVASYVEYKILHKNIGPRGTSIHQESQPLLL